MFFFCKRERSVGRGVARLSHKGEPRGQYRYVKAAPLRYLPRDLVGIFQLSNSLLENSDSAKSPAFTETYLF